MQADFSVELGRDDPALEVPWTSDDPSVRYYDLKVAPELVAQLPEVIAHPPLRAFLARINAPGFPLATVKCDAWLSREMAPEEEIFGDRKFVSYVDLVFQNDAARCSLARHEEYARELCRLLAHAPNFAASVEIVIRRCYFHRDKLASEKPMPRNIAPDTSFSGFCFTAYVTGFGDEENAPYRRWEIALATLCQVVTNGEPGLNSKRAGT
jgi:hypothetical protein